MHLIACSNDISLFLKFSFSTSKHYFLVRFELSAAHARRTYSHFKCYILHEPFNHQPAANDGFYSASGPNTQTSPRTLISTELVGIYSTKLRRDTILETPERSVSCLNGTM